MKGRRLKALRRRLTTNCIIDKQLKYFCGREKCGNSIEREKQSTLLINLFLTLVFRKSVVEGLFKNETNSRKPFIPSFLITKFSKNVSESFVAEFVWNKYQNSISLTKNLLLFIQVVGDKLMTEKNYHYI
jgi:hypothetical protein